MIQTEASASSSSVASCCSTSASTSYQSYQSEKITFPKKWAQTIVFKWSHGKLRCKRAMQKIYTRKYKVQTVEENEKQPWEGTILQKSVLYDCLSNIGPISFSKIPRTYGLADLPDRALLKIMQYVEDPRPLASVNTRFNRIVVENVDSLKRINLDREIVFRFDRLSQNTRIYVLKQGRSIYTPEREAEFLEDVFLKSPVRLRCRITFESEVPVAEEVFGILALHRKGLLAVTALTFNGGSMSTGSRLCGADLADFATTSFLEFVRLLAPDLRHINLFTSKHFRYELTLFALVNEIDSLNILYARKSSLVLTPLNIKSIAKSWLRLPDPHDVIVSVRSTSDCDTCDYDECFSNGEITAIPGENGVIRSVVCSSTYNGSLLTFELFG